MICNEFATGLGKTSPAYKTYRRRRRDKVAKGKAKMTEKVLLLNATYEPLGILDMYKAVNFLLIEKATPVEGVLRILRHVSGTFTVPTVIKLNYYVNVPRRGIKWSKHHILKRDNWTCIFCGIHPGMTGVDPINSKSRKSYTHADFSVDHLRPQSRGGNNTWSNTACACIPCNQRKANRYPHEAGMRLRYEPKTPRTNTLVLSGEFPVEWTKYLESIPHLIKIDMQ